MIAWLGHLITLGGWAIAALIAARLAFGLYRFARLPRPAKRNYPAALWAKIRWRWLARNLGLAYLDQHRPAAAAARIPFGTSVKVRIPGRGGTARLRFPRARFRADGFGLVATVKTIPKVGRSEFDDNAQHIADSWRCVRVQVTQPKPGRLIIRGLRSDPLLVPLSAAQVPSGVYGSELSDGIGTLHGRATLAPSRLYIGRDEWGQDRYLRLGRNVTGITVGGLPGYGKTSLVTSWLCQLAGSAAVQFILIDGKGAGDYACWQDRALICTGDELPAAASALEDVHAMMRAKFGTVLEVTGSRNAWAGGLSAAFPLTVVVIDECHTFFDLEAIKADRQTESYIRTCRTLTGQLVRKGGSVAMLTIVMTQKQTGDAIPTIIRDNSALGVAFAMKTREGGVASLGDHIREYPSFCPTGLQHPDYVGVATTSLRTHLDPFVRVRVPEISDQAAADRAAQTAHLNPSHVAEVPAEVLALTVT